MVLRKLFVRDLLLAGLTSGQIGVAASVVFGASRAVEDLLPGDLAGRIAEALITDSVSPALLLALAVALLSWVLAILGTVLAHAGFTLSRSADGKYLHIRRGLLERHESTVPLARIQAIKVVEGSCASPSVSRPCAWRARASAPRRASRPPSSHYCPAKR